MPTATVNSVVDLIRRYQLLEPVRMQELVNDLQNRFPETRALCKELAQRGWLTLYQANQLLVRGGMDLVLGNYQLLDKLGEGGSGQVFKARHQHMKRVVALKLLRPDLLADGEAVQRFYREIEVASQLSHPNIVHAYDAGVLGDKHFLAMEFVEGIDLARLVKRSGALAAIEACEYIRQAALGLQHAHERGLVHRDIKPSNLLLAKSESPDLPPVVKVLDMGLARIQHPIQGSTTRNLTVLAGNTVMQGTPDYLSPEQAIDFHTADIRSDIYSLGCTFYYLLVGQPPFPGGTLPEKLLKHQCVEPPSVAEVRRDLPAEFPGVFGKMLAKDPKDRFQTPGDVVKALVPILRDLKPTAPVPSKPKKTSTLDLRADATPASGTASLPKPAEEKTTPKEPAKAEAAKRKTALRDEAKPSSHAQALVLGLSFVALFLIGLGAWGMLYLLGGSEKKEAPSFQPAPTGVAVKPTSPAPPTQPVKPPPVFLCDLPELDAVVGWGQFGKKGDLGFDNKRIKVKGKDSPHGLSMHAKTNAVSHVTYLLSKQYQLFSATAAINETGNSKSPLTFKVLGDRKVLWTSRPLQKKDETNAFSVSVAGVEKLDLEVHCTGDGGSGHAVWLEPQLTK